MHLSKGFSPSTAGEWKMADGFKITTTPEWDALHVFDCANPMVSRPPQAIAREIACKYGQPFHQSMVDDIAHAIMDARDFGRDRAPLEATAIASSPPRPERPIDPETRAGNILERYVGATYVASILTEFMGAGLAIVDRGAKIDTSSGE